MIKYTYSLLVVLLVGAVCSSGHAEELDNSVKYSILRKVDQFTGFVGPFSGEKGEMEEVGSREISIPYPNLECKYMVDFSSLELEWLYRAPLPYEVILLEGKLEGDAYFQILFYPTLVDKEILKSSLEATCNDMECRRSKVEFMGRLHKYRTELEKRLYPYHKKNGNLQFEYDTGCRFASHKTPGHKIDILHNTKERNYHLILLECGLVYIEFVGQSFQENELFDDLVDAIRIPIQRNPEKMNLQHMGG